MEKKIRRESRIIRKTYLTIRENNDPESCRFLFLVERENVDYDAFDFEQNKVLITCCKAN